MHRYRSKDAVQNSRLRRHGSSNHWLNKLEDAPLELTGAEPNLERLLQQQLDDHDGASKWTSDEISWQPLFRGYDVDTVETSSTRSYESSKREVDQKLLEYWARSGLVQEEMAANAQTMHDLEDNLRPTIWAGEDGIKKAGAATSRENDRFIDRVALMERRFDDRHNIGIPAAMAQKARAAPEGSESGVGATEYAMGDLWTERMRRVLEVATGTGSGTPTADTEDRAEYRLRAISNMIGEWQQTLNEDLSGRENELAGENSLDTTSDAADNEDWLQSIESVLTELQTINSIAREKQFGEQMQDVQTGVSNLSLSEQGHGSFMPSPSPEQVLQLLVDAILVKLQPSEEVQTKPRFQARAYHYQPLLPPNGPEYYMRHPRHHPQISIEEEKATAASKMKVLPEPLSTDSSTSPLFFGSTPTLLYNVLTTKQPKNDIAKARMEAFELELGDGEISERSLSP